MDWREEALVISVRPHGESAAILQVFTAGHGRHAGVVRGGAGRRLAPVLQPGAQVQVDWRARLDDHIGVFAVEPLRSRAVLMQDRLSLAALTAVCGLLQASLPERDPHPGLWQPTMGLLQAVEDGARDWPARYLRWEMQMLDEMGFGLDLATCAVTGAREDLAFVSPRTGRAVSRAGAGDWAPRLLPLPPVLLGQGPADAAALAEGLAVTGHFLARALAEGPGKGQMPEARRRLADLLQRG